MTRDEIFYYVFLLHCSLWDYSSLHQVCSLQSVFVALETCLFSEEGLCPPPDPPKSCPNLLHVLVSPPTELCCNPHVAQAMPAWHFSDTGAHGTSVSRWTSMPEGQLFYQLFRHCTWIYTIIGPLKIAQRNKWCHSGKIIYIYINSNSFFPYTLLLQIHRRKKGNIGVLLKIKSTLIKHAMKLSSY